jgi:hypothetical protein
MCHHLTGRSRFCAVSTLIRSSLGVGSGNAQPAGYWAKFTMAEGLGIWAIHLLHVLTGYRALYLISESPGPFDNMASNFATHLSAYTKQKLGWLDPSAIRKYVGRTAEYHLHTLGLVQPPPDGMTTAVQVDENSNFLMVEARQRVDQFDGGIPSEGVIVYEVQNLDNYVSPNVPSPSVKHNTPEALKPGQRFLSRSGVAIHVNSSNRTGYSIRLDDTNLHFVDRSDEIGAPEGVNPTVCVIPGLGIYSIVYGGVSNAPSHWISLYRDTQGTPMRGTLPLSQVPRVPSGVRTPTSTLPGILKSWCGTNIPELSVASIFNGRLGKLATITLATMRELQKEAVQLATTHLPAISITSSTIPITTFMSYGGLVRSLYITEAT